jgi:hypothetical protein
MGQLALSSFLSEFELRVLLPERVTLGSEPKLASTSLTGATEGAGELDGVADGLRDCDSDGEAGAEGDGDGEAGGSDGEAGAVEGVGGGSDGEAGGTDGEAVHGITSSIASVLPAVQTYHYIAANRSPVCVCVALWEEDGGGHA